MNTTAIRRKPKVTDPAIKRQQEEARAAIALYRLERKKRAARIRQQRGGRVC